MITIPLTQTATSSSNPTSPKMVSLVTLLALAALVLGASADGSGLSFWPSIDCGLGNVYTFRNNSCTLGSFSVNVPQGYYGSPKSMIVYCESSGCSWLASNSFDCSNLTIVYKFPPNTCVGLTGTTFYVTLDGTQEFNVMATV